MHALRTGGGVFNLLPAVTDNSHKSIDEVMKSIEPSKRASKQLHTLTSLIAGATRVTPRRTQLHQTLILIIYITDKGPRDTKDGPEAMLRKLTDLLTQEDTEDSETRSNWNFFL